MEVEGSLPCSEKFANIQFRMLVATRFHIKNIKIKIHGITKL